MGPNRWDAVVFDYGRVLSHSPTRGEIAEFAALVGVADPPFDYDCGRQDCHGHWQRFADAAGIVLSADHIARIVEYENRLWLRTNHDALALAREIKSQGVNTAILSNMPPDLLRELRNNFDWLDEFEVRIWSCEHGVIKPDSAIYRVCLDALGCEPQRTLFFDDRPGNVEGARRVGMDAHLFESVEQAREIVRMGMQLPVAIIGH